MFDDWFVAQYDGERCLVRKDWRQVRFGGGTYVSMTEEMKARIEPISEEEEVFDPTEFLPFWYNPEVGIDPGDVNSATHDTGEVSR
jgi:hypothetical protein